MELLFYSNFQRITYDGTYFYKQDAYEKDAPVVKTNRDYVEAIAKINQMEHKLPPDYDIEYILDSIHNDLLPEDTTIHKMHNQKNGAYIYTYEKFKNSWYERGFETERIIGAEKIKNAEECRIQRIMEEQERGY